MRRLDPHLLGATALSLTLCSCGGPSLSPAAAADGGIDATSSDASEDSVIVVQPRMEAGCAAPTTQLCNGVCVDPTSPLHCGASCTVCDAGAQATCGGRWDG